jgi:tripartite-type tricarboxylate transporter receptor subunit TctC
VPYKGGPAALTDLIAGQVALYVSGLPPALPLVKAGKARGIAVTTAKRSASAPEIPTFAEAGLPGYDVTLWYGMFAPAGVAVAILDRLNAEVLKALGTRDGREKFLAQGVDPTTRSRADFAALVRSETAKWADLIRTANIRAD